MKRQMGGGAHRGPVGPARQRRSIRIVQAILVLVAAALLLFAGYSWGRAAGIDAAASAEALGAPRRPSAIQVVTAAIVATVAFGGALALQGNGGPRLPTPARLEEIAAGAPPGPRTSSEEAQAD